MARGAGVGSGSSAWLGVLVLAAVAAHAAAFMISPAHPLSHAARACGKRSIDLRMHDDSKLWVPSQETEKVEP